MLLDPIVLDAIASRDGHSTHRVLGAAIGMLDVGPASRHPRLHRLLELIGVLERSPESWVDSPVLHGMPWGAQRYHAPSPRTRPDALDGPWPQAPVVHRGLYAPVLSTLHADRREHFMVNATRYLGQVMGLAPRAAVRALRGPRLRSLTDPYFTELLTETSLGQFVQGELDDDDRRRFAEVMERAPGQIYAKADFSLSVQEYDLPGIHTAPTTVLFSVEPGGGHTTRAICVGERVFDPGAGSAWELARYFAAQGASLRIVTCDHPRLHFPSDAINAVTRTFLPHGHIVRALIEPHSVFTLGLNEAVIHHRRSVLHNSQRELYTPFPTTTEGIHALVTAGRHGVPSLGSYRPYRFDDGLFGDHVPYGRYRRAWFERILRFVEAATSRVSPHDDSVRGWADHIHRWVPGFPSGDEILEPGRLAWAIACYICSVSVYHTGDHHSYAAIPIEYIPLRLRVPPPDAERPPARLDFDALVRPEDHFRHQLCHAMFFAPVIHRRLTEVRYHLDDRGQRAHRRLLAEMRQLDAAWRDSPFPRSDQIACSIQY